MDQLNLFSDKICAHCKENPGQRPDNPLLWNGFYDRDTNEYCCWQCHDFHYKLKEKTEFAHMYTEFPVYALGRS